MTLLVGCVLPEMSKPHYVEPITGRINNIHISEGVKFYMCAYYFSFFFIQTDPESLFFNDGRRRIDFVLAYKTNTGSNEDKRKKRREVFEENLRNDGLELEVEEKKVRIIADNYHDFV